MNYSREVKKGCLSVRDLAQWTEYLPSKMQSPEFKSQYYQKRKRKAKRKQIKNFRRKIAQAFVACKG